jgi:hypothetical protein
MLVMGNFSAVLWLAHPELNCAQGVSVRAELNAWPLVDFVSLDTLIRQELDDHFLLVLHDSEV